MTTLEWHGRTYMVDLVQGSIYVWRGTMTPAKASNEADAVRWLTCMSLRKGKARELIRKELAAATNPVTPA